MYLVFPVIVIVLQGTSINDVPNFLAIFDLHTYLVLLYNVQFGWLSWTPLPTLISDVINGRSLMQCLSCSFGQNQKKNIADIIMTMTGKTRYKIGPSVSIYILDGQNPTTYLHNWTNKYLLNNENCRHLLLQGAVHKRRRQLGGRRGQKLVKIADGYVVCTKTLPT